MYQLPASSQPYITTTHIPYTQIQTILHDETCKRCSLLQLEAAGAREQSKLYALNLVSNLHLTAAVLACAGKGRVRA